MNIFTKKEKIVITSEQQKDVLIEKLENANIEYDIREDRDSVYTGHMTYIIRVPAADFKKVC